ncbi:hypothetical protein G8A07_01820 [Roseateles sp. DAIF2]|uniref:hypothetical protein n=1 Tax=Roseateles sp. DAIF2 TaxID=2714952 RepID=UPI0018A28676|nr:hypothetical protein [Roseateles sp. DAIF2]QPF71791.1 hypothetical protein G8A07_01820 [Roseateles sp. DAIF2]
MGSYNTTGVLQKPATGAGKAEDANAGVKVETIEISKLDALQMLLDVVGLIPGLGAPADILNGLISAARGDWLGAGLSLLGVVPIAGEAATAAKIAKNADRYTAGVRKVADEILPHLPEGVQRKLRDAIEKAEAKIDELAGREPKPKPKPDEAPKAKDEGADGGKVKPKPKPECGQRGPYKDRDDHDNKGFNWDHVPSKAALLAKAEEIKGDLLSAAEKTAIIEGAPTIAIPEDLHRKHSETYGGRQNQTVDGQKRILNDAGNLQKAAKENTDNILKHVDEFDPGCRGAYEEAAKAFSAITNEEWDKWLDQTMKTARKKK